MLHLTGYHVTESKPFCWWNDWYVWLTYVIKNLVQFLLSNYRMRCTNIEAEYWYFRWRDRCREMYMRTIKQFLGILFDASVLRAENIFREVWWNPCCIDIFFRHIVYWLSKSHSRFIASHLVPYRTWSLALERIRYTSLERNVIGGRCFSSTIWVQSYELLYHEVYLFWWTIVLQDQMSLDWVKPRRTFLVAEQMVCRATAPAYSLISIVGIDSVAIGTWISSVVIIPVWDGTAWTIVSVVWSRMTTLAREWWGGTFSCPRFRLTNTPWIRHVLP